MATKTSTFKQPANHIFFKSIFTYFNMIRTEIQLRRYEKDLRDLEAYRNICDKKIKEIEKNRKECVSWRLKHSNIR